MATVALHSDNLWKEIKRLAKMATRCEAAVAYVSNDSVLKFGAGDTLIVDASDDAIRTRQTSAKVLSAALKRNVKVFSIDGLHSKVFVFDRVAIVGSANISVSSQNVLVEAAVITDHPETVSAARNFIEQLRTIGKKVDKPFIERILAIPLAPVRMNRRTGGPKKVALRTPKTWLVGITELPDDAFPEEDKLATRGERAAETRKSAEDSTTCWLRFTGHSTFRRDAQPGDTVICIWHPIGKKLPSKVMAHLPILHRQDEPTCTRFYYEEFSDSANRDITWKRFQKLAADVGLSKSVSPNALRQLSQEVSEALHALWEK
jgi:hypothetical protein